MTPIIVFVPGFLRSERIHAALLADWRRDFEVVVWHLPGHLRPRAAKPGLRTMLTQLRHTSEDVLAHREIIIAGESLGGLLGMILAVNGPSKNVRAVLALDPPLAIGKLWPIHQQLGDAWKANPGSTLLEDYGEPVFGHGKEGIVRCPDYTSVLSHRPACPVHVLAGDAPLWPQRECFEPPSLLDNDDRRLINEAPNYQLHVTTGGVGHEVLMEAPDQVRTLLQHLIRDLQALDEA